MPTANVDLQVDQGADFTEDFAAQDPVTGAPTDFSGATARLMFRVSPTDVVPLLSISTTPNAMGSIVLTTGSVGPPRVESNVHISINRTTTSALRVIRCFYELMIDWADGTTTALMAGNVFINPAVTYP